MTVLFARTGSERCSGVREHVFMFGVQLMFGNRTRSEVCSGFERVQDLSVFGVRRSVFGFLFGQNVFGSVFGGSCYPLMCSVRCSGRLACSGFVLFGLDFVQFGRSRLA